MPRKKERKTKKPKGKKPKPEPKKKPKPKKRGKQVRAPAQEPNNMSDTLFEFLDFTRESGRIVGFFGAERYEQCQSFTPLTTHNITSCKTAFYKVGTWSTQWPCECNLYLADGAGLPTGAVLDTAIIDTTAITSTGSPGDVVESGAFTNSYLLEKGTQYAMLFTVPLATSSIYLRLVVDGDDEYNGGTLSQLIDGVPTDKNDEAYFFEYGIEVLEEGVTQVDGFLDILGADTYDSSRMNGPEDSVGQTFIAGVDYNIVKVAMGCYRFSLAVDAVVNLDIYLCDGAHKPTGASLGQASILGAAIGSPDNGYRRLVPFDFETAVPLTEGLEYAVVVNSTDAGSTNFFYCTEERGTPYANGYMLETLDSGTNWAAVASNAVPFALYSGEAAAVEGGGGIPHTDVGMFESWGF